MNHAAPSALDIAAPALSTALTRLLDFSRVAILIDFDGTLVHFATHPDKVVVPPSLIDHLTRIAGRPDLPFAIVTGRPLFRLDLLTGEARTVAVGSHGGEWRAQADGTIASLAAPMPLLLRRALETVADRHRCLFEDKHYTVSLHLPFEQAHKDIAPELRAALGDAHTHYLIRKVGRTCEVLQKGVSKGTGIARLMREPGFEDRIPLYIGDDVADDTSLQVVEELGGQLISVDTGPSPDHPNRAVIDIDAARLIVEKLAQA